MDTCAKKLPFFLIGDEKSTAHKLDIAHERASCSMSLRQVLCPFQSVGVSDYDVGLGFRWGQEYGHHLSPEKYCGGRGQMVA